MSSSRRPQPDKLQISENCSIWPPLHDKVRTHVSDTDCIAGAAVRPNSAAFRTYRRTALPTTGCFAPNLLRIASSVNLSSLVMFRLAFDYHEPFIQRVLAKIEPKASFCKFTVETV